MKLVSKKLVREYLLPESIWNDWPALLASHGLSFSENSRPSENDAPEGFAPRAIVVTRGDAGVGLTSGWSKYSTSADVMMACIDVDANKLLFDEIASILESSGAIERPSNPPKRGSK